GVAFGEERVAARVHHVSRDPVDLADGRDPGGNAPGGPLGPGPLEPGSVGEAQLLQLDPGGADPGAAGGEPEGPGAFSAVEDRFRSGALSGAGAHGESVAGRNDHLATALGDADGDERLSFLEREAARVEELERIVRGGSAGEE